MRTLHETGRGSRVDVIVGSTADEGTTLWPEQQDVALAHWQADVAQARSPHGDRFIAAYGADAARSTKAALQQMRADQMFAWSMRTWARLAQQGGSRAWHYVFDHAPPLPQVGRRFGAFHGGEIAYAFGNGNPLWEEADHEVSRLMHAYWINFARTGDPNGSGLPAWPTDRAEDDGVLAIGRHPLVLKGFRQQKLDAYDAYLAF